MARIKSDKTVYKRPRGAPVGNSNRLGGIKRKTDYDAVSVMMKLGCDPIKNLCEISRICFESGDYNLAYLCNKELAQYASPKKRTIEVQAQIDSTVQQITHIDLVPMANQIPADNINIIDIEPYRVENEQSQH